VIRTPAGRVRQAAPQPCPCATVAAVEETEGDPGEAAGTPGGQAADEFVEPPRHEIPGISRQHVAAMESSDDEAVWTPAGMHHVVLTTRGRRTGRHHTVALPFWRDPGGDRVVVASFAGAAAHPDWYLNGADRTANPEVHVRVRSGAFWAGFEVVDGDDHERTWAALLADRPWYAEYQRRCERRIPLVRLVERRPA
jgi:deazaflavin-dependent oxidoreductase (nitroreductase family)